MRSSLVQAAAGTSKLTLRLAGVRVMTAAWTIRDGNGQLHAEFAAVSPLEVGRRIVPAHFDAFRLHLSPPHRAPLARAVAKVLAQQGWQIVKMRARSHKRTRSSDLPLAA